MKKRESIIRVMLLVGILVLPRPALALVDVKERNFDTPGSTQGVAVDIVAREACHPARQDTEARGHAVLVALLKSTWRPRHSPR